MIPINIELEILIKLIERHGVGNLLSIKGVYPILKDHFAHEITGAYNEGRNNTDFNLFLADLKSVVREQQTKVRASEKMLGKDKLRFNSND